MPVEELSSKYFTRERIRNRMISRAAEIWRFPESEMDDFDPLVSLLMEACAVEFEKISGEIGKTRNRMMERLARLLYPGMIDVSPSYGILQANPAEATEILFPEEQFVYTSGTSDRKNGNAKTELFFSPVCRTKIFDAHILFTGTPGKMFAMTDSLQKLQLGSEKKPIHDLHSLWIGMELNDGIRSLDGFSFYLNWQNQPDSHIWYQYLSFSEWYLDSCRMESATGLQKPEISENAEYLASEFDPMFKIEEQINDLYKRHFIHLSNTGNFDELNIHPRLYPDQFRRYFDRKELQEFKQPLWWIEIRFPSIIPMEAINNLSITINSFPVINRKLNRVSYKLNQRLNMLALEMDGIFLSVKEVINTEGQPVKLIPFSNPEVLLPETYTLRYGVNRFDERNSYETLSNLTELVREESSFFSSLGEDFLLHHIRDLNQVLSRIEEKLKTLNRNHSPYPYLAIKQGKLNGTVTVEFWSCLGEIANRIPLGSKLQPYRNSAVKSEEVMFITSTYGGKNQYNDAEKMDHYKKALLSHNRIVTLQDLKLFISAELGAAAERIECKRVHVFSDLPKQGFVRCMQIEITPASESLNGDEWNERLRFLSLALEKLSVNNIPYRLKLMSK